MEKDLGEKIKEINDEINDVNLKNATNEELMGYLFLVEKMKVKLEKLAKMEDKK